MEQTQPETAREIAELPFHVPDRERFRKIWAGHVLPWARQHKEAYRRAADRVALRGAITVAMVIGLLICLFASEPRSTLRILSIIGLISCVPISIALLLRPTAEMWSFQSDAKALALGKFCDAAGLDYDVDAKRFRVGAFDDFSFQTCHRLHFYLEDQISGEHNGVAFEACEAQLGEEDGDRDVGYRCLLVRLDCTKQFSGRTYVQPRSEKSVRDFARTDGGASLMKRGRMPAPVKLVDPRFTARFRVYATDEIEARYLLTPTYVERLTELAERLDRRLEIAFVRGQIHVAVGVPQDQFEMKDLLDNPDSPGPADRLSRQLGLIFHLVDSLRMSDHTRA